MAILTETKAFIKKTNKENIATCDFFSYEIKSHFNYIGTWLKVINTYIDFVGNRHGINTDWPGVCLQINSKYDALNAINVHNIKNKFHKISGIRDIGNIYDEYFKSF